MSLDTVVADIRDEARARAEEIREEAAERAQAVVDEAESDAEATLADAETEVERRVAQEREQMLSSAQLEAKQERLEARREVLQQVRAGVESALAEIDGDRREELTRTLLDAAAPEFEDAQTVRVYGRAGDEELIESLAAEYDGFEYAGEYDCLGGVVVESDESRVRVNNTFDSLLDDVWEDNLRDVSERLFEQ